MSNSELKKWRSRLSDDEIAEYLTKTERKKCKYKQNILLDGFYLKKKNPVCLYPEARCRGTGQNFELPQVYLEVNFLRA